MLHLMLATTKLPGSAPGLPSSSVPGADPALIAGIAAYRRHPYYRTLPDPPTIWTEGGSRMLDYGGTGPTVLVVPSLVNRAYVLDLAPERSMLRYLAAHGVRPILLDWGWPGATERSFDLTDYIAGRLERALSSLPGPVILAGYCMGGLLALAAAQQQPERVRGLVLLATPWDFHAGQPPAPPIPNLPALLSGGTLPVDAIQTLFTMRDPDSIAAKFRAFPQLDPDSERARLFVALEDWLSDGVPLAAPAAQECLLGWYAENTPAKGTWRVNGDAVTPAASRLPTLVALPAEDRIVPPESARPLADIIPGAMLLQPAAGHVGMVVGRRAQQELWQPLLDWLQTV
jgi:poly(3-hydroxyalkanoate) synthetase